MVSIDGNIYDSVKFQAVVKSAIHATYNPKEICELRKTTNGIVFEGITVLKRGNSLYLLSDRTAVGEAIKRGQAEVPVRIISSVALKRAAISK